jgi:hypothetical protein
MPSSVVRAQGMALERASMPIGNQSAIRSLRFPTA